MTTVQREIFTGSNFHRWTSFKDRVHGLIFMGTFQNCSTHITCWLHLILHAVENLGNDKRLASHIQWRQWSVVITPKIGMLLLQKKYLGWEKRELLQPFWSIEQSQWPCPQPIARTWVMRICVDLYFVGIFSDCQSTSKARNWTPWKFLEGHHTTNFNKTKHQMSNKMVSQTKMSPHLSKQAMVHNHLSHRTKWQPTSPWLMGSEW